MKKTVLLLFCFSILQSCKDSEVKKDETISSDSTVVERPQDPDPTEVSCTVYSSEGVIKSKTEAEVSICLPEIINNDNEYKIVKSYEVSESELNQIVLHFKDRIGVDLRKSTKSPKVQKFTIDLSNLEVDTGKSIEFVVYHDNLITDTQLKPKVDDIFNRGQTNADCNLSESVTKGDRPNTPKVCGTGTIRPITR